MRAMTVRRNTWPSGPSPEQLRRIRTSSRTQFRPIRGLNSGRPTSELPPGFASESENFVFCGGALEPRPGIRQFAQTPDPNTTSFFAESGLSQHVVGAANIHSSEGSTGIIATSNRTASIFFGNWDPRIYETRPTSDQSETFWDITTSFDERRNQNIAVLTNGVDLPKFVPATSSQNSVSDFTNVASVLSTAQTVETIDDRLVWGGLHEDGPNVTRGERVAWSARGDVQDYGDLGTRAGFEDLFEMKGTIQKFTAVGEEQFVIFTELEIWRAEARKDNFAFDFFPIVDELGCPFPETIASSPLGIFFLGADLELYLLRGDRPTPVSIAEGESWIHDLLEKEVGEPDRLIGTYHPETRRYHLYYSETLNSSPQSVLVFDVDSRTWWKWTTPVEVSYAQDVVFPSTEGLGDVGLIGRQEDRRRLFFSSNGTAYEFAGSKDFNTDPTRDFAEGQGIAAQPISARWRSHAIGAADASTRRHQIDGIEVEYSTSTDPIHSTLTAAFSRDAFVGSARTETESLQSSVRSTAWIPTIYDGEKVEMELQTAAGNALAIERLHVHQNLGGRF